MSSGRLRVLKFPWHIGHDYELFKLPFEWEEVARINCDRSVRDTPECEVLIGRRLIHPPALQTARDFQEKTTR